MSQSLAEIVAALPEEERMQVLSGMDPEQLLWDSSFWLRPEQQTPEGKWNVWLILAGRGWGKTRTASAFVKQEAANVSEGPRRIAIVTRVAADGRDVMVEGDSGILAQYPEGQKPEYSPTKRRITWPNGSQATLFSAEEPKLLRGPQFHSAVGDELAAWQQTPDDSGLTAFDNLRIATRLGKNPRILFATTPKRVPVLYDLIKKAEAEDNKGDVRVTRGSTKDNAANLSKTYLDSMYGTYKGSRLAQQELEGEMLDEIDGAVWTYESLNAPGVRVSAVPREMLLRVVGVDPSVAENPEDECGIVVVGSTTERDLYRRHGYVLEDASLKGAPNVWAKEVVRMARKYDCPVVAEVNQGGALVRNAIQQIDPGVRVIEVHSKQGKLLRAEPVAMAYDQGRVHHYGVHGALETQMMGWIPGDRKSPDRIDALVHGLTALMVKPGKGMAGGGMQAKRPLGSIQIKGVPRQPRGRGRK